MAKKKAVTKKKTVAQKKVAPQGKAMPEKKAASENKPKLDRDFMDLLRATNPTEDAENKASAIDSSIIGLFETALNSIKDAKHRIAQGKDVTKEILNATEYLQFGISKLKAAGK